MILVFGRTGQVATELAARVPAARFLGRDAVDLVDADACADAIHAARPEAVINAAAYTAVDRAEDEEPLARAVNADAPTAMARASASLRIPFVHISTDYVFDGRGETPFLPGDTKTPKSAYGRTKLAGEEGVRAAEGVHAIVRTSWVFSAHGSNFVRTMLRLSETRNRLTVVADQVGGPTPAGAIAKTCLTIADRLRNDPGLSGTYHFSGAPNVSWADFARAIFATARRQVEVADISTADYDTPARRPLNSRLDCAATKKAFGISQPDWRANLDHVIPLLEEAAK